MTAKEFLSEYSNQERRINAKIEKIAEYKARATSISKSFGEKVQTTKQANGTEKIICSYIDLQKNLEDEIVKLNNRLKKITSVVAKLSDLNQKEVIELRYINNYSVPNISRKMYLSERQVIRIHGKALENIQKIIDKIEK